MISFTYNIIKQKKKHLPRFIIICLLSISINISAAWYSDWGFRQSISNSLSAGGDLTNFPILVSISNSQYLKYYTAANGYDILFTLSDGTTKLDHEIEFFNKTNGTLYVWVKIPLFSSSQTESNCLYMYFDIRKTGNQQNTGSVWANNYLTVQHFEETAGASISDSSSNGYDGTVNSVETLNTNAFIASGAALRNGSDGFILNTNVFNTTNGSWSIWLYMNYTVEGTALRIFCANHSGAANWEHRDYKSGANWTRRFYYGNSTYLDTSFSLSGWDNKWNNICYTWEYSGGTSTVNIYTNGIYKGNYTTANQFINADLYWELGHWQSVSPACVMDEFNTASATRSADWIATAYSNQVTPQNFRTLGAFETNNNVYYIYGTVSGIISNNIAVSVNGTMSYTANTDSSGNWSMILPGGSYIISISSNGYFFSPSSYNINLSSSGIYNFTSCNGYTVSGNVRNINGAGIYNAAVSLNGPLNETTVTDSSGYYFFTVTNSTYSVQAGLPGYTINPSFRNISVSGVNSTGNDFTAIGLHTISGTIYLYNEPTNFIGKNVWVLMTGDSVSSNRCSATGNYSFQAGYGMYAVTALSNGYSSTPAYHSVRILDSNVQNCDLVLFPARCILSGYVTDPFQKKYFNVEILLDNNPLKPVFTDETGYYSFSAKWGMHTISINNSPYRFLYNVSNVTANTDKITNINFSVFTGPAYKETGEINFISSRIINAENNRMQISFYRDPGGYGQAEVALIGLNGKITRKIYNGILDAGAHVFSINEPKKLASGVYILQVVLKGTAPQKRYCQLISVIR